MRLRKFTRLRQRILADLKAHVEENAGKVERAVKELWQDPASRSSQAKMHQLWSAASAAGAASGYAGVDAPYDRWVRNRAQWFSAQMQAQQADALHAVRANAPLILENPSAQEVAGYEQLATGLTARDAVAVMRYGATIHKNLVSDEVRKAILPGAVSEYARRLRNSRAATIAATELAAAYTAGKLAVYRAAQGLGLDIGDDAGGEPDDAPEQADEKRSLLIQALASGILLAGAVLVSGKEEAPTYQRVWVIQPGACDECSPLDGVTVAVEDEFEDGDPPLHPNCLCAIEMRKV
jgi:hypothetical protein